MRSFPMRFARPLERASGVLPAPCHFMGLVVASVLTLTAQPAVAARATVYRCETPQRVFYTDLGCANAREVELKAPVGRVDPLSSGELARVAEIDRELARRRALMGQQARQTRAIGRSTRAPATCRRDPAQELLLRMREGGHKKSQLRARMRELKTKPRSGVATCR